MQRIQTYLDPTTAKALTKFAAKNEISLSNAVAHILTNYFGKSDADEPISTETKTYFLRIINTLNQALMCVYDEDKVSVKTKSATDCIQKITKQIQAIRQS